MVLINYLSLTRKRTKLAGTKLSATMRNTLITRSYDSSSISSHVSETFRPLDTEDDPHITYNVSETFRPLDTEDDPHI